MKIAIQQNVLLCVLSISLCMTTTIHAFNPTTSFLISNTRSIGTRQSYNNHEQYNTFSAISNSQLYSSSSIDEDSTTSTSIAPPTSEKINEIKSRLIRMSSKTPKPTIDEILIIINELENESELTGIGQSSSISGLLNGEWELIYSSTDITRSSPFFWALRNAVPDNIESINSNIMDQIYDVTDSIPSPLKDVGPAYQQINMINNAGSNIINGQFVSRVKVGTLNGLASSIMTTRGTILGIDGIDGIKIQIDTTKPEQSSIINTIFGISIGNVINENLPSFPSGTTMESLVPNSSKIILRTSYCDDTIRISRNNQRLNNEFYIFIRKEFANYEFL